MAGALPWKQILTGATVAVSLARDLMKRDEDKPRKPAAEPPDPNARLAALQQRLDALERSREEHAKVVKMLADEVQGLARRAMVGYWIGVAGLVAGLAALAVAWLR